MTTHSSTTASLDALAERFLRLPFSFITPEEAERLAGQIRQGQLGSAVDTLEQDIEVHEDCGNQIKANVEIEFHEELAQAWERSL